MSAPYTEDEIIKFIKEQHIEPYYQPIRSISDQGSYTKFEVLARIEPKDQEEVAPFFFLNISKTANIYHLVTEQIISKSFKKIASLKKDYPEKNLNFQLIYKLTI